MSIQKRHNMHRHPCCKPEIKKHGIARVRYNGLHADEVIEQVNQDKYVDNSSSNIIIKYIVKTTNIVIFLKTMILALATNVLSSKAYLIT